MLSVQPPSAPALQPGGEQVRTGPGRAGAEPACRAGQNKPGSAAGLSPAQHGAAGQGAAALLICDWFTRTLLETSVGERGLGFLGTAG